MKYFTVTRSIDVAVNDNQNEDDARMVAASSSASDDWTGAEVTQLTPQQVKATMDSGGSFER